MFLFRNANLKGCIVDILCEGGRIFKIEENIENFMRKELLLTDKND